MMTRKIDEISACFREVLPIQENQQNTTNRSRKSLVFSFAKTSRKSSLFSVLSRKGRWLGTNQCNIDIRFSNIYGFMDNFI